MLPIEITGDIIFKRGGIQLIQQISHQLTQLYHHIIEEYIMITSPIIQEEFEQYLKVNKDFILDFSYNRNNQNRFKGKIYSFIKDEHYYEWIIGFKNRIYCLQGDRSIVSNYEIGNFDLLTIFNIIKNRTTNKSLIRKVCFNTAKFYCRVLKNECLWLYLYNNLIKMNPTLFCTLYSYNVNLLESFQKELFDQLNKLCEGNDDNYYQYSSYIIKK